METARRPGMESRGLLQTDPDESPAAQATRPMFRWLGRHVHGFYSAVGAALLLAAALIGGTLALFGFLAFAIARDWTRALDGALLRAAAAVDSRLLDSVALEVTALGGGVVVGLMALVVSGLLWITRHRWSVLLLWSAILGGFAVNWVLKSIFDRARPDVFEWRVPHAGHTSFPSGHSMNAAVAYATMAYLIVRLEPTRTSRWVTGAAAALVIVMVGASRVYLGVHYPTDVAAGFLAGLGWVAFCAVGVEALRYFRGRKPEVEAQERDLDGPEPEPERS
jgi:undecaprenyl-diphosphatase